MPCCCLRLLRPVRLLLWLTLALTTICLLPLIAAPAASAIPSPTSPTAGCPPATAAEVETIARRYFDAFNAGDVDALEALLAADYRHQGAVVAMQDRSLHKERLLAVRSGFPDGVYTINWLIVDGDTVAVQGHFIRSAREVE